MGGTRRAGAFEAAYESGYDLGMSQPSPADISRFVEAFEKLAQFEATQRRTRGYGVFRDEDCPVPAVVVVLGWLRELVDE